MAETECRRVHISGLNPTQCSVQDLRSRFESFQLQVRDIHNWPPGVDGVGNVQTWCFLTLEGESAKIKRAMQILSGTVWKGSKLRIGTAKEQTWEGGKTNGVITEKIDISAKGKEKGKEEEKEKDEEEEKTEKRKEKKKSRRIESSTIDQPVKVKDVDEGLWGWKRSPAGHLIKPIHLRPDHPLPKPTSRPVDPSSKEKTDKGRSKRSTKGAKPPSRAKRVTLDPSRYGSVHLSSVVLDDGSDGLPKGFEWVCDEVEDGDLEWSLKDAQGEVVKTERVKLQKAPAPPKDTLEGNVEGDEVEGDDEDEYDDDDDDDDDDSMMSDLAAAIENASSMSSSSESEAEEQEEIQPLPMLTANGIVKDDYDPAEESDFSEGYQEMQANTAPQRKEWKEEKLDQIALLKRMFGELPSEQSGPSNQGKSVSMSDSEEEDDLEAEKAVEADIPVSSKQAAPPPPDLPLTGAQKRAALLNALTSSGEVKSFKPLVRFDPGSGESKSMQEEADEMMVDSVDSMEPGEAVAEQAEEEEKSSGREIPTVQMASLKDMFRPKEDTAGFSLLGDLDLELEAETEEEDGEEWEQAEPPTREAVQPSAPLSLPSQARKAPMFFPTSTDAGMESWLSILQNDRTVPPFCRDKSDEEIQAIWKERKGTLTQEYKRRHREALKKKKRKYTGARAAGTAMAAQGRSAAG